MERLLEQQAKAIDMEEDRELSKLKEEKKDLLTLEKIDRDWKLHQKKFDEELKTLIEKFLMKHFGKNYNSDLFSELYQVITNLLIYYKAEPRLF